MRLSQLLYIAEQQLSLVPTLPPLASNFTAALHSYMEGNP